MSNKLKILVALFVGLFFTLTLPSSAQKKDKFGDYNEEITGGVVPVIWHEPTDIASRDLVNGVGGAEHAPKPPFKFIEEDKQGSNPKFDVEDSSGVKWKVKLGPEAKPETAASRLVWAAGYFVDEEYFLHEMRVSDMPKHLKRGDKYVQSDGLVMDARLKRHLPGEKKLGTWEWRKNPFLETKEFCGLRVMMALINNWDLKDENNAISRERHENGTEIVYMISDLGASFGTSRLVSSHEKSRGNLDSYLHSKFIRGVDGKLIDFEDPHRPTFIAIANPHEYFSRVNMEWIGRQIPVEYARWMGQLLAKLTPEQLRDAFRTAGFTPEEVEGFASELESRIGQLNHL